MSKRKQLFREFMIQEKRYQRAKAKAQKYIHLAEAWNIIMKDAACEQSRINDELEAEEEQMGV